MGCKAGYCNKTSNLQGIFILRPSVEGWPSKAKEATSTHEVKLTPLETNPLFQCLGEKYVQKNLSMYLNIYKKIYILICTKTSTRIYF